MSLHPLPFAPLPGYPRIKMVNTLDELVATPFTGELNALCWPRTLPGDFREYQAENCYDLHYAPLPHARPFSFGRGNLWRIAVDYPGNPVPPCIHRAPTTLPGQPPRLLLIS